MTEKNVVRVGYKEFMFPTWEGHKNLEHLKKFVKTLSCNSEDSILTYAATMYLEREYFHQMLLFIQAKLDNHNFGDEPLGLCLDSSKELFDIMITPCEVFDKNEGIKIDTPFSDVPDSFAGTLGMKLKICPCCNSKLDLNKDGVFVCSFHHCPYVSLTGKIYREKNMEE